MEIRELIYKRKSVRSYSAEPVERFMLDKIRVFADNLKPLYPEIKTRWAFVEKSGVRCMLPFIASDNIAIFSEDRDGALENIGFMFQQLDLYIESLGLGSCWIGMGRLNSEGVLRTQNDDGLKYMIMLTFGYLKGDALRNDTKEFSRKSLAEISDIEDARLEAARLAPSSVNSQPWYFTHTDGGIHAYCMRGGIFRGKGFAAMNRIDMGIALAHIYVENTDTFSFFRTDADALKDRDYIGSFTI